MRIVKKLILPTLFVGGLAQAADQAMIVFDASGSMWGRVDGREKILVAKDALKQVVGQWNPKTQLGLMAYGHRQKGDCNDIEVLVPVSGFDKNALLQQVKGISPKGKTPISRSLQQAADTLRYTEDKATVILISDGKETCDADPCATAKALDAQGIDFVTHVIGFNVDKATDAQLSCVAKATGGQYFSAKNAQALNQAMQTVVNTVQKAKPKPVPVKSKYSLHVIAVETEGGKQVEATHWIQKAIDEDNYKDIESCTSYVDKACKERIPVGEYSLLSQYNKFEVRTPFSITAGETTKLNVVMGQTGKVQVIAVETEGGKQVEATHWIQKAIDEDNYKDIESCGSSVDKACKERIPVGEYFLLSQYNKFEVRTPFSVKAGQTTKLNVVMGQTGKVQVIAVETEGGKQVEATHWIQKAIDEDNYKDIESCGSSVDKACKERIPVGEYFLLSQYNKFKVRTPFSVKAGETTKLSVAMGQTGKVQVIAVETEGGKQVEATHWIQKAIDEDNYKDIESCGSSVDKACKERIPVGEYFLLSQYNKFKVRTPFSVKAGQTTKLSVAMGQTGKVQVIAVETEGGKQVEASHWIQKAIDEDNYKDIESCGSSVDKACKERIPVGEYFLYSRYNKFKVRTPFSVKAGQTTKLVIDLSKKPDNTQDKQALINADGG